MMGGGLCWLDYDGDGWMDLFVVNSYAERDVARWQAQGGLPRSALFHNEHGRFVDVSPASHANVALRGNGCVAADLDRDGDPDLFVTDGGLGPALERGRRHVQRRHPRRRRVHHRLVHRRHRRRRGRRRLAGPLRRRLRRPQHAAAGTARASPTPTRRARPAVPLARRRGRRRPRDLPRGRRDTRARGGEVRLRPRRQLRRPRPRRRPRPVPGQRHQPEPAVRERALARRRRADPAGSGSASTSARARRGVADPNAGMGVALGDYDGDGRTDLFVANARGQQHGAYRATRRGGATFADVRTELGPDCAGSPAGAWPGRTSTSTATSTSSSPTARSRSRPGEGRRAARGLVNVQGSSSTTPARRARPRRRRRPQRPRAAVADYDNDGDLDVAISSVGGRLELLQNRGSGQPGSRWRCDGFHPGAEVTGRAARRPRAAPRAAGRQELPLLRGPARLFGLGEAAEVRAVVVRLPGGAEARVDNLAVNQVLEVKAEPSRAWPSCSWR